MSRVEQFPHPGGEVPPLPDGPEPSIIDDEPGWKKWHKAIEDRNTYIGKVRQHSVAKAVDEIVARVEKQPSPETRIALAVGCAFLDGGGMPSTGLFGAFGGLL